MILRMGKWCANAKYFVSPVVVRKSGAPLYVNFLVGNDVFAIDVRPHPSRDGMVVVSLFCRVRGASLEVDVKADTLTEESWKITLKKVFFQRWQWDGHGRIKCARACNDWMSAFSLSNFIIRTMREL